MTISLFDLIGIAGQVLFHVVPDTVVPRNEIERLVLAREESASRALEDWLAAHDVEGEKSLLQAGFRRVQPADSCANYVYTRQIGPALDRGASIIICPGKRPFVLRSDEGRGSFVAPSPGTPGVAIAPSAPKP